MQIKLALSTAILGTITVAIASALTGQVAGYAKTSSYDLSETQARTCPALTGETITALDLSAQISTLSNAADANRLLAITALCNGYGYGGAEEFTADQTSAALQSTTEAGSSSFLYINEHPTLPTPQEAAEFDQLPQDRVEFKAPI
ncbi:hypothetical protein [Leptothoe spongobia]|uniref:DUF732 domain-containing protein n=1 Tax=Leptothoe spongobia TAU-MAC 1115 TaxID=1967444 RepID=A0A947DDI7_9CYAN|nr:hypothetical protein [Leptothoe spongobia]MBT9315017.1 hypothetical protein [Leptothoe spongobia TAU-MAC 1115]